jgi:hypothetical protein
VVKVKPLVKENCDGSQTRQKAHSNIHESDRDCQEQHTRRREGVQIVWRQYGVGWG